MSRLSALVCDRSLNTRSQNGAESLTKWVVTGTFARVWLANLVTQKKEDADKVFALKILRKTDVIRLKQVEHVRNERNVLASVAGHPFITTMVASFQDQDTLYMLVNHSRVQ